MLTVQQRFYVDQDQKLGYIASNTFLKQLHDQIKSINGGMNYQESHFYLQNKPKSASPEEIKKNNVDEKPTYFVLFTGDNGFKMMLSGLIGTATNRDTILNTFSPPTSSLIIELVLNAKTNKLEVSGFFNDTPLQLGGCPTADPCDPNVFLGYLESVAKINDVSAACAT